MYRGKPDQKAAIEKKEQRGEKELETKMIQTNFYDAIVIGARCAGSPTATLLARQGYRVLLLEKATFPSEVPRGRMIQALAACRR